MRCKKHPTDLSSGVGVCASCLRERLFSLIAAQAEAQARAQAQGRLAEDRRKSDTHPPPLVFPRSVSPYVCRQKSDDVACGHQLYDTVSQRRFYSTPQVGPTYSNTGTVASFDLFKKKPSKFAFVKSLFRSRSETSESDPRVSRGTTTSSSSSSWLGSIFSGWSKKQSRLCDETNAGGRRVCRMNRGMSPARREDEEDDYDFSPSASGYSSESQAWRRTPTAAAPAKRRGLPTLGRNVSGLAFCMSPLVRASPNRQWNQKGMPPEIGLPGEIRVQTKPNLSTAAAFCANRSRKLADFGRFNHNHWLRRPLTLTPIWWLWFLHKYGFAPDVFPVLLLFSFFLPFWFVS